MQYQVQREYNNTAKLPNATAQETLRVTAAWDSLQTKVRLQPNNNPNLPQHQWRIHAGWGRWLPPSTKKAIAPPTSKKKNQ